MYEGEIEGLPYILDIEQALQEADLTEREREVIEQLQLGVHPKEIGKKVKLRYTHVYRDFNKGIKKIIENLEE